MNAPLPPQAGAAGHLAFRVAGRRHAIPLAAVQELLPLPLLQAPEAPSPCIAGLLPLRGRVVRVLDLARRLGLPARAPRPEDGLIVLAEGRWALWVETVEDVLEPGPIQEGPGEGLGPFERGLALHPEGLVHLLDLDRLLEPPFTGEAPEDPFAAAEGEALERFRSRAETCQECVPPEPPTLRTVLVFALEEERFALGLADVLEIVPAPPIHPLPGAGQACLGLASHRGEPLLVLDPRPRLGLPAAPSGGGGMLILVAVPGRIALAASEVFEVQQLEGRRLRAPLAERPSPDPVEGLWVAEGRTLALLRLEALLAEPEPSLPSVPRGAPCA